MRLPSFVALAISVSLVVTAFAVPAEAAVAKTAPTSVSVTLRTPSGMPADVVLHGGTKKKPISVVATKPASGTKRTVTLPVAAGRYTVTVPSVEFQGGRFAARTAPQAIVVRAKHTSRLTVVLVREPGARSLRSTDVTTSSVALTWSAAKGASYVLRRATGGIAPSSRTAGRAVPIRAVRATDTALAAGTAYAYALFSKLKGHWYGPITARVTTMANPTAPATAPTPAPSADPTAPVDTSSPTPSSTPVAPPVQTPAPVETAAPVESPAPVQTSAPVATTPAPTAPVLTGISGFTLTTQYAGGGTAINVRTAPDTGSTVLYTRTPGTAISIVCQTIGSAFGSGTYASNRTWDMLGGADSGYYVHDVLTTTPGGAHTALSDGGYVAFSSSIPQCSGTVVSTPPTTNAVVAWAAAQVGKTTADASDAAGFSDWAPGPYGEWSGDCAKFVIAAWRHAGHEIAHGNAAQQYAAYAGHISTGAAPAGALVFYPTVAAPYGHIAISDGNGNVYTTQGLDGANLPIAVKPVGYFGTPAGWTMPFSL